VLYDSGCKKACMRCRCLYHSGQFGVLAGDLINSRTIFTQGAGGHLFETPLSAGQVLTADADGRSDCPMVNTVP
jgi:hypothetical protein